MGPSATTFRISMSRVPCGRSDFGDLMGPLYLTLLHISRRYVEAQGVSFRAARDYSATMTEAKHTNALIHETSPYLLGHAHNPVQWYPWAEEALRRAREEDKPILLSIGYSACHWCHVMERESFENEAIARLMNENFVNIKVDREERPDLDAIYMNAVQMMTGHGGWPMTMFLTPNGVPFYGGTYFPPDDRYNMPGFPRVLSSVAEAYRSQPDQVANTATSMLGELRRVGLAEASREMLTTEILDSALRRISSNYD